VSDPTPIDGRPEMSATSKGRISFVIAALNEPPALLEATIKGLLQTSAGYAREIIIVDDGSLLPVCVAHPEVRVVRNLEPIGTAQSRRYGASLTSTSGDVLVSLDAHMRFASGWLDSMLEHVESGALLCAAWWEYDLARPLCWGADFLWCCERNYAAKLSPGFAYHHRTKHPGDGAAEVPMLIGACYMMLRKSYQRLGGFSPFFRTWGRLEQDISMRAWIVGLGVKCVSGAHVGHFTRSQFPYAVSWADVEFNQMVTVRTAFEEPVARAVEQLFQPLPSEVQTSLNQVDFRAWRQSIQSQRRISDAEFFRRFVPNAPEYLMREDNDPSRGCGRTLPPSLVV
jgi:glycosyltransferase involved in cell wall biosynthesis